MFGKGLPLGQCQIAYTKWKIKCDITYAPGCIMRQQGETERAMRS